MCEIVLNWFSNTESSVQVEEHLRKYLLVLAKYGFETLILLIYSAIYDGMQYMLHYKTMQLHNMYGSCLEFKQ